MVLIMTNYFLCKLCIHTHLRTRAHTHTHTHRHTQTQMMPNLGLHDYALRSSWPHTLTSTISAALPRTSLTPVCVLRSHQ